LESKGIVDMFECSLKLPTSVLNKSLGINSHFVLISNW